MIRHDRGHDAETVGDLLRVESLAEQGDDFALTVGEAHGIGLRIDAMLIAAAMLPGSLARCNRSMRR